MVEIRRDDSGRIVSLVKGDEYNLDRDYMVYLYYGSKLVVVCSSIDDLACECGGDFDIVDVKDDGFMLRLFLQCFRCHSHYIAKLKKRNIGNTCHCGGRIDIVGVGDSVLDLRCSDCGARYIAKLIKEVVEPCRVVHIDTQRDFYDIDEWYGNWYKCPYCKHSGIWYRDNYCSRCGSKLEWSGKDRDE